MRRRFVFGVVAALALAGCAAPAPAPALQPEDVVRPQVVFVPDAPWTVGGKGAIGILVEVHRPGREGVSFLQEKDIPLEGVEMQAKVTFLAGDAPLGEPLSVPFVRDC